MKRGYPKAQQAINSPKATNPAQTQNGPTSKKYNSAPTIKPLKITGYKAAIANLLKLKKQIHKHARNVAAVPTKKSIHMNENKFAIAQPSVNP